MEAVRFSHVCKAYRVGRPWGIKDALLGSARHRHKSRIVRAVNDVSFCVREGDTVALLGHNGSGKSTVLKLLAGTIYPTSGNVHVHGRVAPLLELGAGFHPDLTGRENIFLNASILGVRRTYVKQHLDEIIGFAALDDFIDSPVRFYSTGMSTRLGFAVAVHVQPEIILIDEVLAVGDEEFRRKCLAKMAAFRDQGRTLILVTHSLELAQSFCDRALILSHGHLTFDGPVEEAEPSYVASTRASDDAIG